MTSSEILSLPPTEQAAALVRERYVQVSRKYKTLVKFPAVLPEGNPYLHIRTEQHAKNSVQVTREVFDEYRRLGGNSYPWWLVPTMGSVKSLGNSLRQQVNLVATTEGQEKEDALQNAYRLITTLLDAIYRDEV